MILSIETSCDDSSIAITEIASKRVLFHKKLSQDSEHSKFGGVVPELASRLHAKALPAILNECKEYFNDIKAIAVTTSPGLSVTLLEGLIMAKALFLALKLPIIAIDHLLGHIYSLFINKDEVLPISVLLISGGHTMIIELNEHKKVKLIATTLDDSFGESFDKVAKMLNLGYPGGPIIERLARDGDENAINLPIPLKNSEELAFSFSGLKNSIRLAIESNRYKKEDVCASFQKVACLHLLEKLEKYFQVSNIQDFGLVGGASANIYLRSKIELLCKKYEKRLHLAELSFCSDNAAMIGRCAIPFYLEQRFEDPFSLDVSPKSRLFIKN